MKEVYLVIGYGSIGKRHLSNLRQLRPKAKIVLLRMSGKSSAPVGIQEVDKVVFTMADALRYSPVAALICTPASTHISIAITLAESGVHLMVEKPLSNELEAVLSLTEVCRKNDVKLFTAYNFRFCQAALALDSFIRSERAGKPLQVLIDAGQYLPDWRPQQDYKSSISASQELGGGALLELSHELDYAGWLFGGISSIYAQLVNSNILDIEVEDNVNCIATSNSGIPIFIHLDFLQKKAFRQCKIICTEGTIIWQVSQKQVYLEWQEGATLLYGDKSSERNDMYLNELECFLLWLGDELPGDVKMDDGLETLKVIMAARMSAETGQLVKVNN